MGVRLRDYQADALEAIRAAEARGVWAQLVVLPTGCGKTVLFGALVAERVLAGQRALVLVHREELVDQTVEKLLLVDPGLDGRIGVAAAGEIRQGGAPVLVGMVQTLARHPHLTAPGAYGVVVVDEAHHAVAGQWLTVLERCGAGEQGCLLVGVTATPNRTDGVGLGLVFREVVYSRSVQEMVSAGVLTTPRGVRIRTDVDLDQVPQAGEDLEERALQRAVNTETRNAAVVRAVREVCAGRKTVVFTTGVEHAENLSGRLQKAGVPAAAVSGQMPAQQRRRVLADFRAGRLQAVTNCNVLTEGFDEPAIGAVVMARPTTSEALYIQQVGRGLRRFPGKRDCLVVDLVDASRQHRLVQLADLFGEKAVAATLGRASGGGAERLTEEEAGTPVDAESLAAELARRLVLVQEEADLLSPYEWVPVGDGWVLPMPGDAQQRAGYVLVPDVRERRGWMALEWAATADGGQWRPLMDKLAPVEWAQGVAETAAQGRLAATGRRAALLVERSAAWRQRPATAKQLEVLQRAGVETPVGLTAGQAARAMSAVFWRRRVEWATRNLRRFVS